MTTTENTASVRTRSASFGRGFARTVLGGEPSALDASTRTPVVVFAVLMAVAGLAAGGTGHLWQLPVVVAAVALWGWAARVRSALARGEKVHPLAAVLATPVLVVAVVLMALVAVVSLVDPTLAGGSR